MRIVPKPTIADNIRDAAVELLKVALEDAEAGKVAAAIVILKRPDGTWCDERSGTTDFPDAIGRLEIVKQSWIAHYLSLSGG